MKNTGRRYDAILLLGLTLGENDQPEEELCIRAHAAAKAYQEYAGTKVIACGGVTEGHTLTEAEVMEKLLCAFFSQSMHFLRGRLHRSTNSSLRKFLYMPFIMQMTSLMAR